MIGAKMKYVVFDSYNGEQIIIFPKAIQHSVMADNVKESSFGGMRAISGGFIVNGECVGESESLRMKSRLEVDTALIPALLDLDEDEKITAAEANVNKVSKEISKNKAKRLRQAARRK
mgnify:CR=1 FL=1